MGELLFGGAIHKREQAAINARRTTRKSGNERRGAEADLARTSSSIGNQRILDAAGTRINNLTETISRNLDAAAAGDFSTRIAAAEELGANVASAAAAGVGGSSVEGFNATLRLQRDIEDESIDRRVASDTLEAARNRGYVLEDAVAALDSNAVFADQDYTIDVDHKKSGFLSKLVTVGAAAAATYFGGPKAGAAVINLSEAGAAARNGDFASAQSSLITGAKLGYSTFQDKQATKAGPAPRAASIPTAKRAR